MAAGSDLGDRLAERGPVHDEDRQSRPQKRREHAEDGVTLDDLRGAVTTLEETERIAQRVLGGAHPTVLGIEENLQKARAALRARESLSGRS